MWLVLSLLLLDPLSVGGKEGWFDAADGSVVCIDTSGVPVRVAGPFSDAVSASAALSGGVSFPSSGVSRWVGYSQALVSVVSGDHHSRVEVESAWFGVVCLSSFCVVGVLVHGVVLGYWVTNQRSTRL